MNAVKALNTYKNVGLESGVAAADPHKLILMLYQGAALAIGSAKNEIARKQIAAKGASITKAIKIIDEGLKACLDVKAGGEIARNLSDLYDYMNQRLLMANMNNDIAMLDEVSALLAELKGAWESISPVKPAAQTVNTAPAIAQAVITQSIRESAPPPQATPVSAIGKKAVLMYGRM